MQNILILRTVRCQLEAGNSMTNPSKAVSKGSQPLNKCCKSLSIRLCDVQKQRSTHRAVTCSGSTRRVPANWLQVPIHAYFDTYLYFDPRRHSGLIFSLLSSTDPPSMCGAASSAASTTLHQHSRPAERRISHHRSPLSPLTSFQMRWY